MSPELAEELAEAFREHRDAFGVSITIGSDEITAIVQESEMSRDLSEIGGGFHPEMEFHAKALLSDLSEIPALGAPVVYSGQKLKISRLAIHPGGLIAEFSIRPRGR